MHGDIEIELARSREIIAGGSELVPRFRITTPKGLVSIFVQLPDDILARNTRMQLVADFMMVRMATAFVFCYRARRARCSRGFWHIPGGQRCWTAGHYALTAFVWPDCLAGADRR